MSNRLPPPIDNGHTKPIGPPCRVLPIEYNLYGDITADYRAEANVWREVSRDEFDEAMNVLPPILLDGVKAFMVPEPYTHVVRDGAELAVCAAFVTATLAGRQRYFVRYCTRPDFAAMRAELVAALRGAAR